MNYKRDGFVVAKKFISVDVCDALLAQMKRDMSLTDEVIDYDVLSTPKENAPFHQRMKRKWYDHIVTSGWDTFIEKAFQIHSSSYAPLATFHWATTTMVSSMIEKDLVPTYAFFRIYREGMMLPAHTDRDACEHSVSLLLGSSHELPWNFEISIGDGDSKRELVLNQGDAVIYKGITQGHGRKTPNPNRWSAHLFMHWVDRNGTYADSAFETDAPKTFSL